MKSKHIMDLQLFAEPLTQEQIQEQLIQLQEQMKQALEDKKNIEKQLEEKTKREKELEEYNQKLFLRITNKVEDNKGTNEDKIPLCIDKDTYEKLSDKDIKELNELLEGEE